MNGRIRRCGLVVLKPDAYRDLIAEKIIEDIKKARFRIILRKDVFITKKQAELIYLDNKEDDNYSYAIGSLLDGKITLLIVGHPETEDVLQRLAQLKGKANQDGLRKKYMPYLGENIEEKLSKGLLKREIAQNRLHVPDSIIAMKRIIKEFFTTKERVILFIKTLIN